MAEEIFYTIYSLIIQICGIMVALIAVYSFFRFEKISDLLIGQGITILKQQEELKNRKGPRLVGKYLIRLRDDIDRKNISGIEEALLRITIDELNKGLKAPNGYYEHVFPKFLETKAHLNEIKKLSFSGVLLLIVYSGDIDPPFRVIDPSAGGNLPEGPSLNVMQ